jgi:hypothetical protein
MTSLQRYPITEKYATNKIFFNKILPNFDTLYGIILRSINTQQNQLLVPYETLRQFNTIVMGLNINKQIERYNKITKKINDFIKVMNNQIYRLIKQKDKYLKEKVEFLPEDKERLLKNNFINISKKNQPYCFNGKISIPGLLTGQKIILYNGRGPSLTSITSNEMIYYYIQDCINLLKEIMNAFIKISISQNGKLPFSNKFNMIEKRLDEIYMTNLLINNNPQNIQSAYQQPYQPYQPSLSKFKRGGKLVKKTNTKTNTKTYTKTHKNIHKK